MGMNYGVYVGPYVVIPRSANFDIGKWEHIVTDGRFELGVGEADWYLVPNVDVPGITRDLRYGRVNSDGVEQIHYHNVNGETRHFLNMLEASGFMDAVDNPTAVSSVRWGVVVCCM